MNRPFPPIECLEPETGRFEPALDLTLWAKLTFLEPKSKLHNPDHAHLQDAHIGFLWAPIPNVKQGRMVLGTAELGKPMGSNAWKKGQTEQQRRDWFAGIPDFIITLDANYCMKAAHPEFCALVEHELYHCAQAMNMYGEPKFNDDGKPVWAMRGHDVEQFVGVVKRYGANPAMVTELVEAAAKGPTVAQADVAGACGTCLQLVA